MCSRWRIFSRNATIRGFAKIQTNPKFIQGFSDPTGILFPVTTKYDIATIYGNNFGDYGAECDDKSILDNIQIITGNIIEQKITNYTRMKEQKE